ncbi:MAG TPA: orotidine-5'-phosphate decarboxylase, partial [Gemmatimonadales bacterium]|nr:orotidine-5'-phosphate decarboxylase [Gemmatimonadales bacterium]
MAEIVLALDLGSPDEGLRFLDRIPDLRWVKVGPVLLTCAGAPFVQELRRRRLRVFLDLKWHDIPSTVAGAVEAARELGVAMATVHTLGGVGMLERAARAAGDDLALLGVTVLTAHDAATYGEAVGRESVALDAEVRRLAGLAARAGLRGVVCSSHETTLVREVLGPSALVVVPGIRGRRDASNDQVRVSTAGDAAARGATHLVVGRPLLHAADPAAAFRA